MGTKTRGKPNRTYLKRKTRRRNRKGGNDETSGDNLMNMLYNNATTVAKRKPYTEGAIIRQFNRVQEDDLYNSVLRFQKKYPQTQELKDSMWRELYPYQDEFIGEVERIPECKYNIKGKCTRRNPVHKFADKRRLYQPASLIGAYLSNK